MARLQTILYVLVVAAVPVFAAPDFPDPPGDASAAAAKGLQQLDVAALKRTFLGEHTERDADGKTYRVQYGADGSVILGNSSGLIDRGTFSITRQNGGGVCLRLEHQMNQRICAIWFRAGDSVHLFGYNPRNGQLHAVSRTRQE